MKIKIIRTPRVRNEPLNEDNIGDFYWDSGQIVFRSKRNIFGVYGYPIKELKQIIKIMEKIENEKE